jgi:hypothetical protein
VRNTNTIPTVSFKARPGYLFLGLALAKIRTKREVSLFPKCELVGLAKRAQAVQQAQGSATGPLHESVGLCYRYLSHTLPYSPILDPTLKYTVLRIYIFVTSSAILLLGSIGLSCENVSFTSTKQGPLANSTTYQNAPVQETSSFPSKRFPGSFSSSCRFCNYLHLVSDRWRA